ncbi:hypothetical protein NRB16_22870 [Pseudomonas sp. LJDD11]|uniref:hypothetical protein n=1 Tax=unclassified Pseudomonas TaxID=196821 RepID=UPI002096E40B|nr:MULTISPECIES: hypothetical protein [unclassified Pseudomonas]MCO8160550.1 hypothetical protein [Pseudomonas sp. 21LCFQ010]MCQ9426367.1 hypothetical protein [Pseudomonas sp. LJDD11]
MIAVLKKTALLAMVAGAAIVLSACNHRGGSQPDPQTREAMIEQTINAAVVDGMKPLTGPAMQSAREAALEAAITERKETMGIALSPQYWSEYRRNMDLALTEVEAGKDRVLQSTIDWYRDSLQKRDPALLKYGVPGNEHADYRAIRASNLIFADKYKREFQVALLEYGRIHQARMADLDRRYGVCARYPKCWKDDPPSAANPAGDF